MRRERLARGWTTHDVVKQLAGRGVVITEPSYRGYEAGPRVSAPVRTALEAVFGSTAPDTKKEAAEPVELDSLLSAIYEQTAVIARLAAALENRFGGDEPMVPVSAVRDIVRQIVASAPDLAALARSPDGPPAQVDPAGSSEDR
jgi:hypothetical protein